jgi:hypothetical protein
MSPLAFSCSKPIQPLSLDSLLVYAAIYGTDKWKSSAELYSQPPECIDLPLDVAGTPGAEYYRASMMFTPPDATWQMEAFIKKADSFDAFNKYAGHKKQDISNKVKSGVLRQFMEYYILLSTPYIEFYVSTSSEHELGVLLRRVEQLRYIGSKRGAGYGRLRPKDGCQVAVAKDDYSVWKDGKPTRPIPVKSLPSKLPLEIQCVSFRPPYEHPANKIECYIPPAEQWYPKMDVTSLFNVLQKGETHEQSSV